jgi:hypothetical protein
LSSAILYLAIVAIWAVVLVPRWLRPRPAAPQPVTADSADWGEPGVPDAGLGPALAAGDGGMGAVAGGMGGVAGGMGAVAGGTGAVAGGTGAPSGGTGPVGCTGTPDGRTGAPDDHPAPGYEPAGIASAAVFAEHAPAAAVAFAEHAPTSAAAGDAAGVVAAETGTEEAGPEHPEAPGAPPARRAEVVKARRRLLTTLVTLTTIAVAFALTRIDAYWIIIPPGVLLAGYLMLLRKFAHFDAERARRATRARHAAAPAGAGQEQAPAAEPRPAAPGAGKPAPGAEIIDISGRITDQVYDQYADTTSWAVGD